VKNFKNKNMAQNWGKVISTGLSKTNPFEYDFAKKVVKMF